MKKLKIFAIIFALILSFTACQDKASAFDEQYDLGIKYLTDGNYTEAIIAFEAAIEIDSKNPNAYIKLADVYIEMGNEEKAREVLDRGLEEIPDNEDLKKKRETLIHVSLSGEVTTSKIESIAEATEPPVTEATTVSEIETEEAPETTVTEVTEAPVTEATTSAPAPAPTATPMLEPSVNLLRSDELKLFGQPIKKMDINQLKSLLSKNGLNADIMDFGSVLGYKFIGVNDIYARQLVNKSLLHFIWRYTIGDMTDTTPIEARDICLNDTAGEVFTKLGFTNGEEVGAYIEYICNKKGFNSLDEATKYFKDEHIGEYKDENITIEFSYESGTGELFEKIVDGKTHISTLTYKVTFSNQPDYCIKFTFGYAKYIDTYGSDEHFINLLSRYNIQYLN